MDASSCSGCSERDARIADLERRLVESERRLADLEARLKTNATNSSIPPSANPLGADKPGKKKKSKRQRGGQPDHPPHLKQLLPPEQITRIEPLAPCECANCHAKLSKQANLDDLPPERFQTIEVPEINVEVVEYQAHARRCAECGAVTRATIPAEVRAHVFGPNFTAIITYFTGCHGISKRGVEEIVETIFRVPIGLGTIANLEQEVSSALEAAHTEAIQAVRQADVKFADETSWKKWGALCWLWAAATANVAVFVIHAKRSALGLAALLGEEIYGILHSDRWHVYLQLPAERRQLCWAHLKRDFQKVVDCGGPSVSVGRQGLRIVKEVFAAWHAFQDGKVTRKKLRTLIEPLEHRLNKALVQGAFGDDARVVKFCENVLKLESALWTFVRQEGVEPTNNYMERLLRRAVLWRRRSFGCNSDAGCRFVERILTVVQTIRLRGRNVLEYLHRAVQAHRNGLSCPGLLA